MRSIWKPEICRMPDGGPDGFGGPGSSLDEPGHGKTGAGPQSGAAAGPTGAGPSGYGSESDWSDTASEVEFAAEMAALDAADAEAAATAEAIDATMGAWGLGYGNAPDDFTGMADGYGIGPSVGPDPANSGGDNSTDNSVASPGAYGLGFNDVSTPGDDQGDYDGAGYGDFFGQDYGQPDRGIVGNAVSHIGDAANSALSALGDNIGSIAGGLVGGLAAGPVGAAIASGIGSYAVDGRGPAESALSAGLSFLGGTAAGLPGSLAGGRAGTSVGRGIDTNGWDATMDSALDSLSNTASDIASAPGTPGTGSSDPDAGGGDFILGPQAPSPVVAETPKPRDATALYDLIFSPYRGDYRTYGQGPAHQYWQKVPRTNGVSNA